VEGEKLHRSPAISEKNNSQFIQKKNQKKKQKNYHTIIQFVDNVIQITLRTG
jgi:hypothetical protein